MMNERTEDAKTIPDFPAWMDQVTATEWQKWAAVVREEIRRRKESGQLRLTAVVELTEKGKDDPAKFQVLVESMEWAQQHLSHSHEISSVDEKDEVNALYTLIEADITQPENHLVVSPTRIIGYGSRQGGDWGPIHGHSVYATKEDLS